MTTNMKKLLCCLALALPVAAFAANLKPFRYAHWNIGHFSIGRAAESKISDAQAASKKSAYLNWMDVDADWFGLSEYSAYFTTSNSYPTKTTLFGDYDLVNEGPHHSFQWNAQFGKSSRFAVLESKTVYYTNRVQNTYYLARRVKIDGETEAWIVQTHFDWKDPSYYESQLLQLLDAFKSCPRVIISGDFNFIASQSYLKSNPRQNESWWHNRFREAGYDIAVDDLSQAHGTGLDKDGSGEYCFIDNIAVKGFEIADAHVLEDSSLAYSDHFIIHCQLTPTADAHTHSFGAWQVTTDPTETSSGVRVRTCTASGCGHTETRTMEPLAYDWIETVKPTDFVTDYVPDLRNTRLEIAFQFVELSGRAAPLCWASGRADALASDGTCWGASWMKYNGFQCGTSTAQYSAGITIDSAFSDTNAFHTLSFGGNSATFDGKTYTGTTPAAGKAGGQLVLSGMWVTNASPRHSSVRIKYVKLWETSGSTKTLVHHYVPAKDGVDPTLYDLVDKQYLVKVGGMVQTLHAIEPTGKTTVAVPTIASKAYTGAKQTATVAASSYYKVTANAGGTNVGSYPVTLALNDTSKTQWTGGSTAPTNLTFKITQASNGWTTSPALSSTSFKAGTTVTVTVGTPKFGTATANYTAAQIAALPAGSYTFTSSVPATGNYTALTKSIAFTVTDPGTTAVDYYYTKSQAVGTFQAASSWYKDSGCSTKWNAYPNSYDAAVRIAPNSGVEQFLVFDDSLNAKAGAVYFDGSATFCYGTQTFENSTATPKAVWNVRSGTAGATWQWLTLTGSGSGYVDVCAGATAAFAQATLTDNLSIRFNPSSCEGAKVFFWCDDKANLTTYGALTGGASGTTQTLAVSNATAKATSTTVASGVAGKLAIDLFLGDNNATTNTVLTFAGAFTVNAGSTLAVNANGRGVGTYPLIAAGTLTDNAGLAASATVTGLAAGLASEVRQNGNRIDLVLTNTSEPEPTYHGWIQTDGKGYFTTDYTPNLKTTKFEVKVMATNATWTTVLSASGKTTSGISAAYGNFLFLGFNDSTTVDWNNGIAGGTTWGSTVAGGTFNVAHTLTAVGNSITVDGTTTTSATAAQDLTASGPLYLGAYYKNATDQIQPLKVYYLKIWEGDELVRDYAAGVTSDGTAVLYDKVNRASLVSVNGEAFFCGDDGLVNAWTVEPSMSTNVFRHGASVTVSAGTPKYGTATANYTSAQLAALAPGCYTYRATATADGYAPLVKEIDFVVLKSAFAPGHTIICYGDSITAGYGATTNMTVDSRANYFDGRLAGQRKNLDGGYDYPYYLAGLLATNYNVMAQAKSSMWSDNVVAWFGGLPIVTRTEVTVPAAGGSVWCPSNLLFGASNPYGKLGGHDPANPLWMGVQMTDLPVVEEYATAGVWGTMSGWIGDKHVRVFGTETPTDHTHKNAKYKGAFGCDQRWARIGDASAAAFTAPAGATFVPDAAKLYGDAVAVIFAGTNDNDGYYSLGKQTNTASLVSILKAAVAKIPSGKYVVVSPQSKSVSDLDNLEQQFASAFGNHFLNLRAELNARGLSTAVTLGLMTQAEATAAGTWESEAALIADASTCSFHPNSKGYRVIAEFLKDKLVELGYAEAAEPAPESPDPVYDPSSDTWTFRADRTYGYATNATYGATQATFEENASLVITNGSEVIVSNAYLGASGNVFDVRDGGQLWMTTKTAAQVANATWTFNFDNGKGGFYNGFAWQASDTILLNLANNAYFTGTAANSGTLTPMNTAVWKVSVTDSEIKFNDYNLSAAGCSLKLDNSTLKGNWGFIMGSKAATLELCGAAPFLRGSNGSLTLGANLTLNLKPEKGWSATDGVIRSTSTYAAVTVASGIQYNVDVTELAGLAAAQTFCIISYPSTSGTCSIDLPSEAKVAVTGTGAENFTVQFSKSSDNRCLYLTVTPVAPAKPYYNEETGESYATAQEAMAAAEPGEVVKVTANPETATTIRMKAGVTVDTQGFANVTVVAPDPWFDVTRAVGTSYIITLNDEARAECTAKDGVAAIAVSNGYVWVHAEPLCSNLWYGVGVSSVVTNEASAYKVETWTQKSAGDRLDFKVEQSGVAGFLKIFVKDIE